MYGRHIRLESSLCQVGIESFTQLWISPLKNGTYVFDSTSHFFSSSKYLMLSRRMISLRLRFLILFFVSSVKILSCGMNSTGMSEGSILLSASR